MAVAAASSHLRHFLVLITVLAATYPAAVAVGKRYQVGGSDWWIVPPLEEKEELYYVRWASSITFYVDDSIEFEYRNDSVIKVSKAGYYHCNETAGIDAGDVPMPSDRVRVFWLYVLSVVFTRQS